MPDCRCSTAANAPWRSPTTPADVFRTVVFFTPGCYNVIISVTIICQQHFGGKDGPMFKRFFAPFRNKVAQAEQQGFGVFFLELYFYVLILIVIVRSIDLIVDPLISYENSSGLPWFTTFDNFGTIFLYSVLLCRVICLIWQYVTLRKFSPNFFVSLWLFLASVLVEYIYFYVKYLDILSIYILLAIIVCYGLVIYYFYKRKCLFNRSTDLKATID